METASCATQLRLLTLQFQPSLGGFDTRPLDAFVADKELLDVRDHFFLVRELPYLACLITFRTVDRGGKPPKEARPRIELSTEERQLFETLRTWRKERAQGDGVPPYVVFTDRELRAVIRTRPQTLAGLRTVPGVGDGKIERYGKDLMTLLGSPAIDAPAAEAE